MENFNQDLARKIDKWKTEELECYNCGQTFFEYNNLGQWKCFQHIEYDVPIGERYPCCGKYSGNIKTFRNGCIRADHTKKPIPFNNDHDIIVPQYDLSQFPIHNQSLIEKNDRFYVRRFDWEQEQKNKQNDDF